MKNEDQKEVARKIEMKRFILFYCPNYYPAGGMDDCKGLFDTLDEAIAFANTNDPDSSQILDTQTGEIYEPHWSCTL